MTHRPAAESGTRAGAILVALAFGLSAPLSGQDLQYSGSVGYATGSYTFTEQTSSISIMNALTLDADRWSVSGSIPLIIQNSGDVSYVGGMGVPTGSGRDGMGGRGSMTPGAVGSYETTLGDPVIRGTFTPYQGFGTLRVVEVQAAVKAPLADPATGVGTGEWDVGGGVSAGLGLGSTLLFADATVWSPGDLPETELRSYVSGSIGVGRPLGAGWSGVASVSAASSMLDGVTGPASVSGGLSHRLGDGAGLMSVGASFGLTESAPDLAIYLGWSI